MSFDLFVPCMSAESADPLTMPKQLIVDELARELDMRRQHYPDRVANGKMSRENAAREISLMAAIHADMAVDLLLAPGNEDAANKAWREAEKGLIPFKWRELVSCLRREIAMRRKFYPRLAVTSNRSPVGLRAQLERIEAAHFHYWALGRAWWPEELEHHQRDSSRMTEEEHDLFRAGFAKHRAHFVSLNIDPRGAYVNVAEEQGKAA